MNNLNNLSDEEFDDLFRQSAEERNIDFDEGAWQKMSSLLDQKQPVAPKSNWLRNATALLALILLVSVGVYLVKNKTEIGSSKNIEKSNVSLNKESENQDNKEINTNKNENLGTENNENKAFENEKIGQNLNTEQPSENYDGNISSPIEEKSISIESKSGGLSNNEKLSKTSTKTSKSSESKNQSNFTKNDSKFSSNKLNQPTEYEGNNKNISKNELNGRQKVEVARKEKQKNHLTGVKVAAQLDKELNDGVVDKNNAHLNNKDLENTNAKGGKINKTKGNYKTEEEISKNTSNTKSKKYRQNSKSKDEKLLSEVPIKSPVDKIVQNGILTGKKSETKARNSGKNSEIVINQELAAVNEIQFTDLQKLKLNYLAPKTKIKYSKPKMQGEVYGLDLPMPELPIQEQYFKKGLSFRLAISPDLSTIKSNKISKVGSNFGGLLEYRFNKKISVQAGVIRSVKYYDAYPEQYKWALGYQHIKPIEVLATCKMLDFPVNIRYDMIQLKKLRLFTNIGLTSYKMMNENYEFIYDDNNSPYIKFRNWNGKTGSYYAGNLNISVGLEKYLNNKISLQAEPFLKSPIKNIGFAKVPLITYGMMFSAKYPLITSKK